MTIETNDVEQPACWTDINGVSHATPPGTWRCFGINSQEFYEAVTDPADRESGYPKEPPMRLPPVIHGVVWR